MDKPPADPQQEDYDPFSADSAQPAATATGAADAEPAAESPAGADKQAGAAVPADGSNADAGAPGSSGGATPGVPPPRPPLVPPPGMAPFVQNQMLQASMMAPRIGMVGQPGEWGDHGGDVGTRSGCWRWLPAGLRAWALGMLWNGCADALVHGVLVLAPALVQQSCVCISSSAHHGWITCCSA